MSPVNDPFEVVLVEEESDAFAELRSRAKTLVTDSLPYAAAPAVARFHGFAIDDQPLISVPQLTSDILRARTIIPLVSDQVGSAVVVMFEDADVHKPIVIGVIRERSPEAASRNSTEPARLVSVERDGDRLEISAEREIILRCGSSSITLTRAGKVIIRGSYIVSRSTGVNKVKGAAIDIN
jgi:hypothetical protein